MENQMSLSDIIPMDEGKLEKSEQPKLPKLKNMEQREEFVRNYLSWPIWCENKLTQETFYRFDLPNGAAIVVKYYPTWLDWKKIEDHGERYYLIKPGCKYFSNCEINMSSIKEYLKDIQKPM